MTKRYNYRAYPTPEQEELLARTFGSTRFVYNKYVEQNLAQKKLIGYAEACRNLVNLKKEYEWLSEVSSIALQQTLKDAASGIKNYFRSPKTVHPPRYKKRTNEQSFNIVGANSFKVIKVNAKWAEITLPKMKPLKIRTERALPSTPTSVRIIHHPSGKYFVSFVVQVESKPLPKIDKHLAVDLGLTDLAITVNNEGETNKVPNPRYYLKGEAKLAKLQQAHAKTLKGSNNREKARVRVARQHEKVANQRKDFVRKLVFNLVSENQTVITETLSITNMVKNHKLSKSIMDASWGMFLTLLTQKCEETGRTHYQLGRFFPSSKTCSNCGTVKETLGLSERSWTCAHCYVTHDRDINAAMVLLIVGLKELNINLAAGWAESINATQGLPLGGTTLLTNLV